MSKFETSDHKSLKVKLLKPITKVVATSVFSHQKEKEFITKIMFVSRDEGFLSEYWLYPEVDFEWEDKAEYTYKARDIYSEISFVDGFRFSCRCAEGVLKFYGIADDSYVSLSETGKIICTGGSSSLAELRNHLRNKVPVLGTFATGFDEKGVRCVFNNTYIAFSFSDGDFTGFPISETHRIANACGSKGGKPWYFANNAVRWC